MRKDKLACFGMANTSDCCMQCPSNDECVKETMEIWNRIRRKLRK